MTPEQCRQARELLGWTQAQLARAASCGSDTVKYIEAGNGRPRAPTLAAIRAALEAAGVEFVVETEDGAGVRIATIAQDRLNRTLPNPFSPGSNPPIDEDAT